MLTYILLAVVAIIAGEFFYISFLKIRLNEAIKQKEALNATLTATKRELENAKAAKKIHEDAQRLSDDDVNSFLQDGGYFRQ